MKIAFPLLTAAFSGVIATTMFSAAPAEAKIRCNGPWQVTRDGQIATPYCGDNYLARVAKGYGSRVTARMIRQNPNKKAEICQWIGHDTRIQDICAGFRNDDSGNRGR
ncbi:MAG: hypothetical protein K0U74_01085 [Alphaproteobacteria bacterium]|nr:hypothetical protein [Alphaproteobacteria bacterium]